METIQWGLVAVAALFANSCVTAASGAGGAVGDDVALVGEDGSVASGKDVPVTDPDRPGVEKRAQPSACSMDKECQALGNACNLAICSKGQCILKPLAANAPCDDGDPCTVNTTCKLGACVGVFVCYELPKLAPFFLFPPSPLHP